MHRNTLRLALAVGLVFAACGGSKKSTNNSGKPAAKPPATQPAKAKGSFAMRLVATDDAAGKPVAGWDGKTYRLVGPALLEAKHVDGVLLTANPPGVEAIQIQMTAEGKTRLAEASTRHLHRKLAILIDGKVAVAPTVHAKITGGRLEIATKQARKLYRRLVRPTK